MKRNKKIEWSFVKSTDKLSCNIFQVSNKSKGYTNPIFSRKEGEGVGGNVLVQNKLSREGIYSCM